MAAIHLFAVLLVSATVGAYVQVPLYPPKPQVLEDLARTMQRYAYTDWPFVGNIPWYPYSMDIGVGTPAQTQSMVLSLSHYDSFILYHELCVPGSDLNLTDYTRDCSSGAFDDEESKTFSYNSTDYYLGFFADNYVTGVMMEDTVSFGDSEWSNASLGIALETALDSGFFGLCRFDLEGQTPLLDQMMEQELIESPAFSIFADEKNETTGSILFGAVDKSKYEGTLQRIQASAGRDKFAHRDTSHDDPKFVPGYIANVSAVWRSESSNDEPAQYVDPGNGGTFYATIDPTFALTNVPDYVAHPIYQAIGHVFIRHNIGMWTVMCNRTDISGSLSLELGGEGGYRLNVTLQDLIVPAEEWHLLEPPGENFAEPIKHCLFGIQSTESSSSFNYHDRGSATPWVVGSMVLKNTYTVFDSQNMEVGLAPLTLKSDSKADITPFGSSGAHAPDSKFVGYEKCFVDCEIEDDDDKSDAGQRVALQKYFVISIVLGVLGFYVS